MLQAIGRRRGKQRRVLFFADRHVGGRKRRRAKRSPGRTGGGAEGPSAARAGGSSEVVAPSGPEQLARGRLWHEFTRRRVAGFVLGEAGGPGRRRVDGAAAGVGAGGKAVCALARLAAHAADELAEKN